MEEKPITIEQLVVIGRERDLEAIKTIWIENFEKICIFISEALSTDVCSLSQQDLSYFFNLFKIIIRDNKIEEDLKTEIHKFILENFISWLNKNDDTKSSVQDKIASEILLCIEIEPFCFNAIDNFFKSLLYDLDNQNNINSKVFSIFSQLLKTVESGREGNDGCFDGPINPEKYLTDIIKELCTSTTWPPSKASLIINSLSEIKLNHEQLNMLVEKSKSIWEEIDINEIPPFVYQLLLLSKKGARSQIISQIITYFNEHNVPDLTKLKEYKGDPDFIHKNSIESTILHHLLMAVKQDQNLGLFIIKYLKSGKLVYLSPFTLSILFSMSSIQRFEDEIFSHLKSCVLNYYDDLQKIEQLSEMKQYFDVLSISDVFSILLLKCSFGWDQVSHGLIEFFTYILDIVPRVFGQVIENPKPAPKNGYAPPLDQAHSLAISSLLNIYTNIELFKPIILEKIISRILSNSDSIQNYIKLFEKIISSSLHQLPMISSKIKDLMPAIITLPISTAKPLLRSWKPIINIMPSFLDSLMITLKKGLFTRALESRIISVYGLVFILKQNSIQTVSNGSTTNKANISPICLEILGILNRCLSQQAQVKVELYNELIECCNEEDGLKPFIGEFLLEHAYKTLNLNKQNVDLAHIKKCISSNNNREAILAEPLPMLLKAIISTLPEDLRQDSSKHVTKSLQLFGQLESLIKETSIIEFGFDKETTFELKSSDGSFNYTYACLTLGIYENLIDYKVKCDRNNCLEITEAYLSKFFELFGLLKTRAKNEKGKLVIKNGIEDTLLSIDTAISLLQHATLANSENDQPYSLSNSETISYLLESFNIILNKMYKTFRNKTDDKSLPLQIFGFLVTLCFQESINENFKTQECQRLNYDNILRALDILYTFDNNFTTNFQKILNAILSEISCEQNVEFDEITFEFIFELTCIVNDQDNKIALNQLSVINKLISILLDKKHQRDLKEELIDLYIGKIREAFKKKLNNMLLIDTLLVKEVLKFELNLSYFDSDLSKIPQLSYNFRQVLSKMNFGNEESESDDDVYGSLETDLINDNNIEAHLNIILTHINNELDSFSFYIQFILLHFNLNKDNCYLIKRQEKPPILIEKVICSRLNSYITAFKRLVETSFNASSCENILACLSKFFKFMRLFTKFKLNARLVYSKDSFINICEIVGKLLFNRVFNFLSYLQSMNKNTNKKVKKVKGNKNQAIKINKSGNKEIRMQSNLVLNLENFESTLIELAKTFKLNIMSNFKRTIARDYRIDKSIFLRSPSPEIDLKDNLQNEEQQEDLIQSPIETIEEEETIEQIELVSESNNQESSPEPIQTRNKRKNPIQVDDESDHPSQDDQNSENIGYDDEEDVNGEDRYDSDIIDDNEVY